ncbi:28559_t:CDS:2, partial [Gigaspora margarita]
MSSENYSFDENQIRNSLTQGLVNGLVTTIKETQQQNQINIDNYENVTALLELSGTTRFQINATIVDALKKKFIKVIEIENWDDVKFKNFLTKSMRYFFVEELRPIIFTLLEKYPKRMTEEIYENLAQELVKKPDIIHVIINMDREAPIRIKRGIYERNNKMFEQFIHFQISKYFQTQEMDLDR